MHVLEHPSTQPLLGDMLMQKQHNFLRTSSTYVVTDKHDMIGTHYLVYDQSEMFKPRLVAAIRTTFEDRALAHGLELPIDNYYSKLSPEAQAAYQKLRANKTFITDCNAWFVDPQYSPANVHYSLSDILFFSLCVYNLRLGKDHFVGATNERYKASRWVAKVGKFPEGFHFTHPSIPDPHKLTLVETFDPDWLKKSWGKYAGLVENTYLVAPNVAELKSLAEVSAGWLDPLVGRAA